MSDLIEGIIDRFKEGTVAFLGLLCFLAFAVNAALLVYLLVKKSTHGLARCPKCGRVIVCPHCTEDEEENEPETV